MTNQSGQQSVPSRLDKFFASLNRDVDSIRSTLPALEAETREKLNESALALGKKNLIISKLQTQLSGNSGKFD